MRLCLFSGRPFEETFENAQWRKVKQMQPMWLCLLWPKFFEDTYEETQIIVERSPNFFGSFVFLRPPWQLNLKLYISKHYMFRHPALITCSKRLRILVVFNFHPDLEKVKVSQNKLCKIKGRTDWHSFRKLFLKPPPSGVCSPPTNCPSPPSPLSPSMLSITSSSDSGFTHP